MEMHVIKCFFLFFAKVDSCYALLILIHFLNNWPLPLCLKRKKMAKYFTLKQNLSNRPFIGEKVNYEKQREEQSRVQKSNALMEMHLQNVDFFCSCELSFSGNFLYSLMYLGSFPLFEKKKKHPKT